MSRVGKAIFLREESQDTQSTWAKPWRKKKFAPGGRALEKVNFKLGVRELGVEAMAALPPLLRDQAPSTPLRREVLGDRRACAPSRKRKILSQAHTVCRGRRQPHPALPLGSHQSYGNVARTPLEAPFFQTVWRIYISYTRIKILAL